jgi:hypothetical protein
MDHLKVKSRFNKKVKSWFNFLPAGHMRVSGSRGWLLYAARSTRKMPYVSRLGNTAPVRALAPRWNQDLIKSAFKNFFARKNPKTLDFPKMRRDATIVAPRKLNRNLTFKMCSKSRKLNLILTKNLCKNKKNTHFCVFLLKKGLLFRRSLLD